jgi:hypothetical protein
MKALKQLLLLERPTSKSITYKEWLVPPKIIFEDDKAEGAYHTDAL